MSVPLSDEQKAKRVNHFKRIIKYRSWFGWLFSIVGAVLFGVGVKQNQDPMVMLNGFLFWLWVLYGVASKKGKGEIGSELFISPTLFHPFLRVKEIWIRRIGLRKINCHP